MFLFIKLDGRSWAVCIVFKYILCSYSSLLPNACGSGYISFKYILCSYSSTSGSMGTGLSGNSNTSYVLIHQEKRSRKGNCSYIQIHPMFLFINCASISSSVLFYSNTSYVLIHHKQAKK